MTQRHGFRLEERTTSDFDLVGMRIEGTPSLDELKAARTEIERMMQPAEDRELLAAMGKLKALTANRNMTDQELDMQIEALVSKLKEYPRDAALKALDRIADEVEWFPSWSQIKKLCLFYSKRRKFALGAIEVAISREVLKKVSAA